MLIMQTMHIIFFLSHENSGCTGRGHVSCMHTCTLFNLGLQLHFL